VILETFDADIDLYFTIPNFMAVTASGHAPGLSLFIKEYGGAFLNG